MRIELLIVSTFLLCGCVQKMGYQGRLRPYDSLPGILVRLLPDGVIPWGPPTPEVPVKVTRAVLQRGQQRFNIYCAPCHGPSGYGNGVIVQRGFLAPPSYHIDRLRQVKDEYFFQVITHGFGAMYSYEDRVNVPDRWAITSYIRALQLSQNAPLGDLTAKERSALLESSP